MGATQANLLQRVLVIGYGSIGARHARLLVQLGCNTAVLSGRSVSVPILFDKLPRALREFEPELVVIANATAAHRHTLAQLAQLGFSGTVLVEKPLFDSDAAAAENMFRRIYVAYNLRFHPVVRRLKELLEGRRIVSVQSYVGQFLPDWRPGTDYRTGYSAHADAGGGALRDLSHELDFLTWMLGTWERVAAVGGHYSSLDIDSDDVFALLLVMRRCPVVTVQMNYLDRPGRRDLVINTDSSTIEADIRSQTITIDGESQSYAADPDESYLAMHRAVLAGNDWALCTLGEGLEIVRLIAAAENAARAQQWILR